MTTRRSATFRQIRNGLFATALVSATVIGIGGAAEAAPRTAAASSSTAAAPITATFALMIPNAPVVFTVNGNVVATGTTNANGDVSVTYTPAGLAPGYYRLVASTSYGVSSSVAFGVS